MKNRLTTILLVLVFFVGLSVLLYPTVSDYWNSRVQTRAIVDYEAVLSQMKPEDYSDIFDRADRYNERLREVSFPLMNYNEVPGYEDTLDISGTGIMAYVTIPKIGVDLPIYHGTSDAVLSLAVGHVQGTSLPVGGEGTHSVLSAHRGLPTARLFTDLGKLTEGDTFTITVLDRVLTYAVDQILIVLPKEVESLYPTPGADYCTLVTCTPYGINSHRLLVRGVRVETAEERAPIVVQNQAYRIDPLLMAPLAAAPMLLVLFILLMVKYPNKKEEA